MEREMRELRGAGISSSGISGLVTCASAVVVCAGMVNISLGAMPKSAMQATQAESGWVATPPILEELCARLAAFGLVEPMGMEPRSTEIRQCKPVLLRLGVSGEPEPTSIFTTVRAGPGRIAGSLSIRFKLNALEPNTQGQAVVLLERAVRSILRGYDLEMPYSLAVALEKLEDGSHSVGPIRLEIATEREDARRHNIFLSIQALERHRTNFRPRGFTSASPAQAAEQVHGGL
jgi:hypothetical protein